MGGNYKCDFQGSSEQHVRVQRCTAFSNTRKGGIHHGVFKVNIKWLGNYHCTFFVRYAPAAVETQDKAVEEYKKKLEQESGPQGKGKKKKN